MACGFLERIRRHFARDDRGVSEVLGFVLMFGLSSIVLVASVQSFSASKENADSVVAGVELRGVANRVSARVVQAALLSEDFPNATVSIYLRVPQSIKDQPYQVFANENGKMLIRTVTQNQDTEATATTFNVAKKGLNLASAPNTWSSDEALLVGASPGNRHWNFTAGETPGTQIIVKGVYN